LTSITQETFWHTWQRLREAKAHEIVA